MNAKLVKSQNRAAWIVEWHCPPWNARIKKEELRPYILPHRWNDQRIFECMRCLFWNSSLFYPNETLRGVNKPDSHNKDQSSGYMIRDGARLFYGLHGDACRLVAGFTKNLCITRDETGRLFMKWTRPPGSRRDDATGRIVSCGSPVERKWSLTKGRWSCDSEP